MASTDETFFNGTIINGTQTTIRDEFVNSTVTSASQGSKRKTRKSLPVENSKAKNPEGENKENGTGERKRGKALGERKREILKDVNGNSPGKKATAAKAKSEKGVILKVEPSPRKSKPKEKTPATPKIVIYEDEPPRRRSCRIKAERQTSKSCEGRKKSEKAVASPRSKSARHSAKEPTNSTSPEKSRGRLSRTSSEMENLMEKLENVFPNADPEYLKNYLCKFKGSISGTIEYLITKEKTNELPTRADYVKRQEVDRQQRKYLENFSIENFLKMFPDPWEYFLKQEKQECVKYKDHSVHYLKNKFKKHYTQAIQAALMKNGYSLYRASKELQKKNRLIKMRSTNRSKAECDAKRPTAYNERFMHEVAFVENEAKIKAHIKKTEAEKHKKFKQAKKAGTLLECLSCNDPSLLLDDAVNCPANHVFCKDCVVRSVDAAMKNNNFRFKCLIKCEEIFSTDSLRRVLTTEMIERIQNGKQLEEVKAAGIENLVWCSFCSYATIMPPELSVLHCLNPDCLKETCRRCKQLNHVPLKCHELEEFEKSVREGRSEEDENDQKESPDPPPTCDKCNGEYLETDETNKLVCPCGATICSICRQPIPKCPHSVSEPKGVLSTSDSSDDDVDTDTPDEVTDSQGSRVFDFDQNLADFYPSAYRSL